MTATATTRSIRAGLLALAAAAASACDPKDELLVIMAQVPPDMAVPKVTAYIDSSERLRWEAEALPLLLSDQVYVMWLAPADWTTEIAWTKLGPVPRFPDGTAVGWFTPDAAALTSFAAETRPLAISIETVDQIQDRPSPRCVMWTGRFPSPGLVQSFAYGDPLRALRVLDLVTVDGNPFGPYRGFARFEISYLEDQVLFRLWNVQSPQPGHKYVLWANGTSSVVKLLEIDALPRLEPTRPSEVLPTAVGEHEFDTVIDYDPNLLPYGELVGISISYELATPPSGHGHAPHPEGVVVLAGQALSHDSELADEVSNHHGGGGGHGH